MREYLGIFIIGAVYLGILYVLVRPGSTGATAIQQIFSVFTDLVRGVTGQTYDPESGKWSS